MTWKYLTGSNCTIHTSRGNWVNSTISMWRRCGVASCSRLCSESMLNEAQNLDSASPASGYQTTPSWAGSRSQDALLWPTDPLGWPSNTWALTLYLIWQKGQLVKADTCLCPVSGASNFSVVSRYSMLQASEMFLRIWYCCIACDKSYLGNRLNKVEHALGQPRRCLCSRITDALRVPCSFCCYPIMFIWVLAYSPYC